MGELLRVRFSSVVLFWINLHCCVSVCVCGGGGGGEEGGRGVCVYGNIRS